MVLMLISYGTDINAADLNGNTPLHLALMHNYDDIALTLIDHDANVKILNEEQESAIHLAAKNKDKQFLECLLEHDVDIDAKNFDGESALHLAVKHVYVDNVHLLLKSGANVDNRSNYGETPLFEAVLKDNIELTRLLIEKNADIEVSDMYDDTLLHVAVKNQSLEIVKLLLEKNIDLNAHDNDGFTAYDLAINNDFTEMIELIDKFYSNLKTFAKLTLQEIVFNYIDANGNNILHLAIVQPKILPDSINVNLFNKNKQTALHLAAIVGSFKGAQYLIEKNANLHLVDSKNRTPLELAVKHEYADIVNLLIESGAKMDFIDDNGDFILHKAASANNFELVEFLMPYTKKDDMKNDKRYIDLNATNKLKQTALHIAMKCGFYTLSRVLINNGADFNAKDYKEKTLFDYAMFNKKFDIYQLIANYNGIRNMFNEIFGLYFIDLSERQDEAIRLLNLTNELEIDLETGQPNKFHTIRLNHHLFKDAGKLNDNNAIVRLMKDAVIKLLKNTGFSKSELMKCAFGSKKSVFTSDCYFILYGNEFKLSAIVLKLSTNQIQELGSVFDPNKKAEIANYDQELHWLHRLFREFKECNPENKKQFIQHQFGNKLKHVDGLDQLIGDKTNEEIGFEDYLHIYNQATIPPDQLCKDLKIENKENFKQELNKLFSKDNFAYKTVDEQKQQEMDNKPLRDFWIASSHNTYLTDRQIFGKSSVLAYIKVLLTGCRCIELDLWPLDGRIVVNHGNTFSDPIPLENALEAINEYAFKASQYPLILSLEDHCDTDLQANMADLFKEYLGDLLLTEELEPKGEAPALNRLMGKILIKHSAVYDKEHEEFEEKSSIPLEYGIFDVKYAQNDIWHRKRVTLYNNRIEISDKEELTEAQLETIKQKPQDQLTQEEQAILDEAERRQREKDDSETAHPSQDYYHGVLGAKDAIARLNAAKEVQSGQPVDGKFLIRRLSQLSDEYVLSVIHQGRPKHMRISETNDQDQQSFSIENDNKFTELTNLIDYHEGEGFDNDIPIQNLLLGEACERPAQTLTQQEPRPRWFFPNMSHARTYFLLQAYPEGTCLVRTEEDFNQDGYILTVRLRYVIRHFRLKQEGDKFYVNSKAFNSVEEIIEYYQRYSFVDGIRLEPIYVDEMTDQTVDEMMEQYNEEIFYEGEYYEEPIKMRTFAPFLAQTLFGQYVDIPSDQLIDKLKESPSLILFSWNFHYYFINPDLNNFWAEEFDPNAFHTFKLNGQVVNNKLEEEPERQDGSERKGIELKREETDNQLTFIYNYIRFSIEDQKIRELWKTRLNDQIQKTNQILSIIDEDLEPSKGDPVHPEMSKLAVYFKTFHYEQLRDMDDIISYNKICSITHKDFTKYHKEEPLNEYNAGKMSWIYPNSRSLLSGNYDPIKCWNMGSQMVALNYQTNDVAMLQNYGRFLSNGGCGYVAKPDYLKTPITADETAAQKPMYLTIKVISGRNLSCSFEHSSGICSPMVEFWLDEIEHDQGYQRTKAVRSNGLNPVWKDQQVSFEIRYPELALIRLQVIDAEYVGRVNLNYNLRKSSDKAQFVGQAAFPVNGLQEGIRSIPLLNTFNDPLELSALLVEITIRQVNKNIAVDYVKFSHEKPQKLGISSKQPEPMEIDHDQPGPSGTSFK